MMVRPPADRSMSEQHNLKYYIANSGQFEWWHDQTISAGRGGTTPTWRRAPLHLRIYGAI